MNKRSATKITLDLAAERPDAPASDPTVDRRAVLIAGGATAGLLLLVAVAIATRGPSEKPERATSALSASAPWQPAREKAEPPLDPAPKAKAKLVAEPAKAATKKAPSSTKILSSLPAPEADEAVPPEPEEPTTDEPDVPAELPTVDEPAPEAEEPEPAT